MKPNADILLINLDRSEDRFARSKSILEKYELSFTRISAVDGRELPVAELSNVLGKDFSHYYKVLTASEVGCYLSHKKCWQHIVDASLDYAVILEDDFSAFDDVKNLHDYIARVSAEHIQWDCIKLMEYPEKRKEISALPISNSAMGDKAEKRLVRYNKVPIRACAYVLSQEGAKKMLKRYEKVERPVDIDFQYWWESGISVWGLKPYVFSVNLDTESTIDSGGARKSSQKSIIKQYLHKISFAANNKHHTKLQQSSQGN